ncbi:MAG: ABC transporter permease [Idiomarina sp.]|nr:ABC transporter permease [Idiomarina sp.]
MQVIKLAIASLLSRKSNAILTLLAIAISVMLLLGVERVSQETRTGFANTISGTDLIVGARSGSVNLLLYSVFHIGNPTNNVSWETYQHWANNSQVTWSVPIALGDSVRGFPVVATEPTFFEHFRYGQQQPLVFTSGAPFSQENAVIGAEVARRLGLQLGDELVVAHGTGSISFHEHDDQPLTIAGVLARTGTPVDQAIYISLRDLDIMHGGHAHDDHGHEHHNDEHEHHDHHEHHGDEHEHHAHHSHHGDEHEHHAHHSHHGDEHEHHEHHSQHGDEQEHHEHHSHHGDEQQHEQPPIPSVSAFMLGLQSRPRAIFMQREINTYRPEPLTAIMPGATLQDLWRTLSGFERALSVVSGFVLLAGLLGMLATILASLRERRREMAVLRSIGAGPGTIFTLLVSETVVLTLAGIAVGIGMLYGFIFALAPYIQSNFGVVVELGGISSAEWLRVAIVLGAGFVISLIPAWQAYRNSLTDGLSMRL